MGVVFRSRVVIGDDRRVVNKAVIEEQGVVSTSESSSLLFQLWTEMYSFLFLMFFFFVFPSVYVNLFVCNFYLLLHHFCASFWRCNLLTLLVYGEMFPFSYRGYGGSCAFYPLQIGSYAKFEHYTRVANLKSFPTIYNTPYFNLSLHPPTHQNTELPAIGRQPTSRVLACLPSPPSASSTRRRCLTSLGT